MQTVESYHKNFLKYYLGSLCQSTLNYLITLLCVIILSLNATSMADAQERILNKPVTIQLRGVTLSEALSEIGSQAGVSISYSSSQFDTRRSVSVSATNKPLSRVLSDLLGIDLNKLLVAGNQITIQASAGKGTVSGIVQTSNGQPAAYITVSIQGQQRTQTDEQGQFTLKDVEAGRHTMLVSYLGLQTQQQNVTVVAGKTSRITFILDDGAQTLQTVEVTGRKATSYKSDYSSSATKVQMALVDIPQTISTVTKELIQDRQAIRLNDIVQNVAGVNQFSAYDDITIRGFRSTSQGYRLLNGMKMAGSWTSPMLVNIERIEVIKGPASATFANSNPGGTVNLITKKPLDESRESIDLTLGSYNTIRAQADFTGPLDSAKTLLYRLNLGYENGESFRDQIFNKNYLIAPSVSFLPKPGTRFNADLVYGDLNSVLDRGHTSYENDKNLYSTPINENFNQPGDYLKNQTTSLNFSFSQELGKHHVINAAYMISKLNENINEHNTQAYLSYDSVSMGYFDRRSTYDSQTLNLYINSTFTTGILKHNLVYGYDYSKLYSIVYSKGAIGEANGVSDMSISNPEYFNRPIENYTFNRQFNTSNAYSTQGIYLQEAIRLNRLQVLLSLRQEFYRIPAAYYESDVSAIQGDKKQNALLPRIGITYALTKRIHAYATYTTGFQPQSGYTLGQNGAGGPFDPLKSNLLEAGGKAEFFNKRLFAGLSVYQIIQKNVLVTANDPENPNLLRQRGKERARGIEFETTGSPLPNLSVSLNYAYNVAKITEDSNEELIGTIKEGAPKHSSGSWIKYTLNNGNLKGLGISVGHTQVSKRNTLVRELVLPGYLTLNGGLFYQVARFRLSGNIYNITNKSYFVGGYGYDRNFPGTPRNFFINVGYTF